jgi:ABC-type polysaccharide/polyol phosphate export permease
MKPDLMSQISKPFNIALADLTKGTKLWRIWVFLAWENTKATYSRSLFGLLWITLTFACFIFAKIIIFSNMFGANDKSYFELYLVCGFFAWQASSSAISGAASVFTRSQAWIKNDPLPFSVYIFEQVFREVIALFYTALVVVAVFLYFSYPVTAMAFMAIPAVLAIIFNAIWVKMLLGVVATRYRDIQHLVQTIMRVMLFLTPIFWMPSQVGKAMTFLWWNPLFHFLEVFRAPLIDGSPAWESWIFVGCVTVFGWLVSLFVFGTYKNRIAYWL